MKNLLICCILLIFSYIQAEKAGNLAILPLKVDGQYKEGKEESANKFKWLLTKAINKTKTYEVIKLEDLRSFLKGKKIEIKRFSDFDYRTKYLPEIFPKVHYCIEGELIFQTPTTISVSLRLVEVKTTAILKSAAIHESIENLEKLTNSLIEKLIPKEEVILDNIKNDFIVAFKNKDYEWANALADWALRIYPQHPQFLYYRGGALEKRGLYQEAQSSYEAAIQSDSEDSQKIYEALLRLKPLVSKRENNYKTNLENLFQKFEIFEKENYTQSIIEVCSVLQNSGEKIDPLQQIIDETVKLQKDISDFILWMNRLHGSEVSEKNEKIIQDMAKQIEIFRSSQQKLIKAMRSSYNSQYPTFITRSIEAKKNKNYDQALLETDYALLLNEKVAEVYYHRGIALGKKYMYEEAIEAFSTAIRLNPKYWEAYFNRAQTYLVMDQQDKALADFLQTNKIFPYAPAYFEIGKTMALQNKLKKALRNYAKAISLDKNFAEAYYERGKVYDQINLYVLSSKDYEKAMKLDSVLALKASPLYDKSNAYVKQQALIHLEIGQDHQKYGNLNEAIDAFDKAIKLNSSLASAFFGKGQILHIRGKYEEAVKHYSRVIEIDEKNTQVYTYLAISLEYLKQYDKALQSVEKALEFNPNLPDVYQIRGRIFEKNKNYEAALQSYDIAVKLLPSKSHYYLDRARMHEQLGNENMAKQDKIHARSIK